MRDLLKGCVLAAALVAAASPASAALVTNTVAGEVLFGPFAGTTGTGSFTYDDALITGVDEEFIRASDGLQVQFTFLGHTFFASDDTDFPVFPLLALNDGVPVVLDFLVIDGDGVGADIPDSRVQAFETVPLEPVGPGAFFAEIVVFVPEPASLGLLLVGGVLLLARRRSLRRP